MEENIFKAADVFNAAVLKGGQAIEVKGRTQTNAQVNRVFLIKEVHLHKLEVINHRGQSLDLYIDEMKGIAGNENGLELNILGGK